MLSVCRLIRPDLELLRKPPRGLVCHFKLPKAAPPTQKGHLTVSLALRRVDKKDAYFFILVTILATIERTI